MYWMRRNLSSWKWIFFRKSFSAPWGTATETVPTWTYISKDIFLFCLTAPKGHVIIPPPPPPPGGERGSSSYRAKSRSADELYFFAWHTFSHFSLELTVQGAIVNAWQNFKRKRSNESAKYSPRRSRRMAWNLSCPRSPSSWRASEVDMLWHIKILLLLTTICFIRMVIHLLKTYRDMKRRILLHERFILLHLTRTVLNGLVLWGMLLIKSLLDAMILLQLQRMNIFANALILFMYLLLFIIVY